MGIIWLIMDGGIMSVMVFAASLDNFFDFFQCTMKSFVSNWIPVYG